MRRRLLGACILVIAAAALAVPARTFVSEWLAVDECLDSGGSFDYAAMDCDHANNHPYVSFEQRHPGAMQTLHVRASVGAPFGVLGLLLIVWPKQRVS